MINDLRESRLVEMFEARAAATANDIYFMDYAAKKR